jgi:hypothetical protein
VPAWAIDGATGDSLTYANVAEQNRALVAHSLRPWIVRLERALSNDTDLCPGNTYVAFDLDGLLRADAKTRADTYTLALKRRQAGCAVTKSATGVKVISPLTTATRCIRSTPPCF